MVLKKQKHERRVWVSQETDNSGSYNKGDIHIYKMYTHRKIDKDLWIYISTCIFVYNLEKNNAYALEIYAQRLEEIKPKKKKKPGE